MEEHVPVAPRQGEKKFELELIVAENKGTLLGAGLPVPMIAGKSDALEGGVVVVVSPAVDKYSAAEVDSVTRRVQLCILSLWLLLLWIIS